MLILIIIKIIKMDIKQNIINIYESKSDNNFYSFFEQHMTDIGIKYVSNKDKNKYFNANPYYVYNNKIYEDDECFLTCNMEQNHMFVVKDIVNKYRFFVGYRIKKSYPDFQIAGMIIYFDPNKKGLDHYFLMTKTRHIINKILFKYDERDYSNMCLYKNILCFYIRYRDHRNIISIGLCLLDSEDNFVNKIENLQFKTEQNNFSTVKLDKNILSIQPQNINIDLDTINIKKIDDKINMIYNYY